MSPLSLGDLRVSYQIFEICGEYLFYILYQHREMQPFVNKIAVIHLLKSDLCYQETPFVIFECPFHLCGSDKLDGSSMLAL